LACGGCAAAVVVDVATVVGVRVRVVVVVVDGLLAAV
jgi:hypothetical protein